MFYHSFYYFATEMLLDWLSYIKLQLTLATVLLLCASYQFKLTGKTNIRISIL